MTTSSQQDISYREKVRLSWALLARIASQVDIEVAPAVLHPGGGQYDCLSLIDADGRQLVMMNRNGESTELAGKQFNDTWTKAAKDASQTALKIVKKSGMPVSNPSETPNRLLVSAAQLVEFHLEDERADVRWMWFDGDEESGPNDQAIRGFDVPSHWSSLVPPTRYIGWQAWLWLVSYEGRPSSLINVSSGEVVYADQPGDVTDVYGALADLYQARTGQSNLASADNETLPLEVQSAIGNYVYALRDPRNKEVFYIGKGVNSRILQHKKESDENPESQRQKLARIQEIESSGQKVEHFFIRTEIATSDEALAIEQAVIDAYDLAGMPLTNLVKGHHSAEFGLAGIKDVVAKHAAAPLGRVAVPLVMLNLNSLWNAQLSAEELYLASRRFWKVGDDAKAIAEYAVIVAFGVVREVYRIHSWEPTLDPKHAGKSEFNGEPAPEMGYLIGKHVRDSIKQGDASSYHKYLDGYTPPAKG